MGKVYDLRLAAGTVPAHVGRGHYLPAFGAGGRLVDGGRGHGLKISSGALNFPLAEESIW
jgi:hypothetical protein